MECLMFVLQLNIYIFRTHIQIGSSDLLFRTYYNIYQYLASYRSTTEEFLDMFRRLYLNFLCYFSQGGRGNIIFLKALCSFVLVCKQSFSDNSVSPPSAVGLCCLLSLNSDPPDFFSWAKTFTAFFSFLTPLLQLFLWIYTSFMLRSLERSLFYLGSALVS